MGRVACGEREGRLATVGVSMLQNARDAEPYAASARQHGGATLRRPVSSRQ